MYIKIQILYFDQRNDTTIVFIINTMIRNLMKKK